VSDCQEAEPEGAGLFNELQALLNGGWVADKSHRRVVVLQILQPMTLGDEVCLLTRAPDQYDLVLGRIA